MRLIRLKAIWKEGMIFRLGERGPWDKKAENH